MASMNDEKTELQRRDGDSGPASDVPERLVAFTAGGTRLLVVEGDGSGAADLWALLTAAGYHVQRGTSREHDAETERRAHEQTARGLRAEERVAALEVLDRVKDEFIITASHDLKSPLTSIKGYSQLLLRQLNRASPDLALLAQGLAEIDAQAGAIARLLDNLLDASRIRAGMFQLQRSPCTLSECLEGVVASLNPEERERIDISLPHAPLSGSWERGKIEEVLGNLVRNALKYSPRGELVRVTGLQQEHEIEVAIKDHGIGIPAAELPRLFVRFYRTPQAEATGLPGTGLGLYICRGIIEAHGGRLWGESAGEGEGATFRFTLPDETDDGGTSATNQV